MKIIPFSTGYNCFSDHVYISERKQYMHISLFKSGNLRHLWGPVNYDNQIVIDGKMLTIFGK